MRWCRAGLSRYAAGLGVAALLCNAAVPVFLAFLLGASLTPAPPAWAGLADGGWLYAPLCRHHDDGSSGDRHGKPPAAPCPVCSLHGTLAVALPAPAATPAAPASVVVPAAAHVAIAEPTALFPAAYRSRAPPAA